ncbi:hypothetical protein [Psychromonas algicola]|uniref:hypothetical protein n=1 Tax=Psychromonas algicola TaxID=2555642 RepID=UPI0010679739|nr:hypothetical protein [Psychromonas sp. RZ5]TEW48971.1 hypothetical protein E2R67_11015 [Psychromonas sp. RZ5]
MKYLVIALLMLSPFAHAEKIAAFTSDGCSAFPDGTLQENDLWLACCTSHDIAYWQGGTSRQRLAADNQLKQCVAAVGKPNIAALMLKGVRIGGSPYIPTSFRWGYGWDFFRGYQALTVDEKEQIKAMGIKLNKEIQSEE